MEDSFDSQLYLHKWITGLNFLLLSISFARALAENVAAQAHSDRSKNRIKNLAILLAGVTLVTILSYFVYQLTSPATSFSIQKSQLQQSPRERFFYYKK